MKTPDILKTSLFIVLTLFLYSCKEKYPLPASLADKSYLVVEGFIDNGNDTTRIGLSRTSPLEEGRNPVMESGANVWIEGEENEFFPLTEMEPGIYKGGPFTLNENSRYRIRIETMNGKSYSSGFEEVKKTPAIDSVSWTREPGGVQIDVNTHDPKNESKYYAWQFEETWEFYSAYYSSYEYVNGQMVSRMNGADIFRCWQSNVSRSIIIGSSAKLNEDIIYRAPLIYIPDDSWKISSRYSVLVKQRCLPKNGYEYLEKMKKNSESLGSIFDPMPTTDRGNITCDTDPSEMVIGYVYVSSVEEKRIFITRGDVGGWRYMMQCPIDTIENNPEELKAYFGSGGYLAIIGLGMGTISHYTASSSYCMDCTQRGTNVKPDFWP